MFCTKKEGSLLILRDSWPIGAPKRTVRAMKNIPSRGSPLRNIETDLVELIINGLDDIQPEQNGINESKQTDSFQRNCTTQSFQIEACVVRLFVFE